MKTKSKFQVVFDEGNSCYVPHLNGRITLFENYQGVRFYKLLIRDINDDSSIGIFFFKLSALTDFVNRFNAPHCIEFWRKFLMKNPIFTYSRCVALAKENSNQLSLFL